MRTTRRPARVPCIPVLLGFALLLAGCGKSGQEYAANVGQAIDRSKANGARGDMQALAAALTSLATQEGDLPEASDIHSLAEALEPTYTRHAPRSDPWGTDYEAECDGSGYVIRSAGQDREWGTDDDLEMQDGQMTKMPAGFTRP
jgi:hypothetical protein